VKPDTSIQAEVLDASAVLAFIFREPGHVRAADAITRRAVISSVNLAEVHSTLRRRQLAADRIVGRVRAMGLGVKPFDDVDAELTGTLRPLTTSLGLSLADRACLALAIRLDRPVLTSDRDLALADVGVEVRTIR
jgi:PIN domain nuclease of toxin-antitoxin system